MPCCGLTEHRQRLPVKYTVVGSLVFWGGFILLVLAGLATCWRASGREMLRSSVAFAAALWCDAMRSPTSVPARWACRLSGRLLGVSPAAAEFVYRHPEAPVFVGLLLFAGIVAGVIGLCWSWA